MKKILLALTLSMAAIPAVSSETTPLNPDAKRLIDVWIESQMDYQQIPYISGSYVKDQKILWSGAYGSTDWPATQAADENTIASICSTSKVFTATAIMKLVDQGKLSLDQKVFDLLPQLALKQTFNESEDITVGSLLNHTSGVPRDTNHSYWSGPDHNFPTENEFYKSLNQQQTDNPVGKIENYSNVGYALLGQIITGVSGKSYKDYIETEIFKPLAMNDSVVEMQKTQYGKKHAIGYTAINRDGKRQQANFYLANAMQPAMGISSNAADLAKFAMWQFREVEGENTELMLSTTLTQMYLTNHSDVTKFRGLGYEVRQDKSGDTWAQHGGMCPGYHSYLKMNVTDKEAYAFTASANKVRALVYINNIKSIIDRSATINTNVKPTIDLTQYEGFYDLNPWNSEYFVGKWGNGLILLYLPADSLRYALYEYQHVEKDTFELVEDGVLKGERIQFNRDSKGQIISILNEGSLHPKINH